MSWIDLGTRRAMVQAAEASVELQRKIQNGCNCCGWDGDRGLILRMVPERRGGGFAVLDVTPGLKPYVVIRMYSLGHEVIEALRESRRNWEQSEMIEKALQADREKAEAANDRREIEVAAAVFNEVGKHLRKTGKI